MHSNTKQTESTAHGIEHDDLAAAYSHWRGVPVYHVVAKQSCLFASIAARGSIPPPPPPHTHPVLYGIHRLERGFQLWLLLCCYAFVAAAAAADDCAV